MVGDEGVRQLIERMYATRSAIGKAIDVLRVLDAAYEDQSRAIAQLEQVLALRPASQEAPVCYDHGVMVADDDMGRRWHCAVCEARYEAEAVPLRPASQEGPTSGDIIERAHRCHKELSEFFPSLPITHREVRTVLERHIEQALKSPSLPLRPAEKPCDPKCGAHISTWHVPSCPNAPDWLREFPAPRPAVPMRNDHPLHCACVEGALDKWAYGSGPDTLAGNDDG